MRSGQTLLVSLACVFVAACSASSAKNHLLLAEKLWTDGKYAAAVTEFDKVVQRDPKGKLGQQALFRSATTQALFLYQYAEATKKFKEFVKESDDVVQIWEAQKQIGDIYFSKTEQYELAVQHYQALLKKPLSEADIPEFMYRVAKSHFFLWQFDEAIQYYKMLAQQFPSSALAEKAAFEEGVTLFTRGEMRPEQKTKSAFRKSAGMDSYQEAMDAFQAFIKKYPQSTLVPEARFGIANCLEELDQLDAAMHAYEALSKDYPSPNVIKAKALRIKERRVQRRH